LKKLSPAEKAWATRRANQQKKAQKRGGGTRRGHRGKRGPHPRDFGKLRPAAGFRKLKSGKRRGEVFPVFDPSKLTPGQKAWDTRRKKHGKTGLSKSHRAKTKPKKPKKTGPGGGSRKDWGPGHPLWEWQQKEKAKKAKTKKK